jgi:hypothetical protein
VNLQTPEAPNTEGPAIHSRLVLLDHTGQVIWSAPFGPPREGTA